MKARLVGIKDPGILEIILGMESIFPQELGYGEEDVIRNLSNSRNFNIIVENDNGEPIGYILGIPHTDAVISLGHDDPIMENHDGRKIYVDQLAVVADERDSEHVVFKFLVSSLAKEAKRAGYERWSAHLAMGLQFIIDEMYRGRIIASRRVRLASCGNLPFAYREGEI